MCGIAGLIGAQHDQLVADMVGCLTHRGPDDDGFVHGAAVSLGMRRLSIVDIAGGAQPISNEDESVWTVFNGEIYNHEALREKLADKGHRFETNVDTEVLVHGYEEWGADVVKHLNGMFAFAVWDRSRNEVVLARDRLGIKPLYYAPLGDSVAFASELTALLEHPAVGSTISERALQQYWAFRYIPAPESILSDVRKLPPATVTTISMDEPSVSPRRYWSLDATSSGSSNRSIRSLLESSVEKRLMADVPLGSFLSGGLDSTTITALMTEVSDDPVQTFSVGFANSEYDESSFARRVADDLGADHHELTVDPESMQIFDQVVASMDEPLADPAMIPTYLLAEHAVENVKVVLTGEGSDELFAGYDYYGRYTNWWDKAGGLPGPVYSLAKTGRRLAPEKTAPERYLRYLAAHADQVSALTTVKSPRWDGLTFDNEAVQDSIRGVVTESVRPEDDYLRNLLRFDQQYSLPDNLLTKVDRMTMANSLEARVPFLDHRIVERVNSIPTRQHLANGTKPVLRRAVSDIVPGYVLEREKHGFNVPTAEWFAEPLDQIEAIFDEEVLSGIPYVDTKKVHTLLDRHQSAETDYSNYLWKILVYVSWYQERISEYGL